jgi:hypothetical protein
MSFLLQLAIVAALAMYFAYMRIYLRRRNLQHWKSLLTQVRSLSSKAGANPSEDIKLNPRGIWVLSQKARVVLEMADYAVRHLAPGYNSLDPRLLVTLRRDAMRLRITAVSALVKFPLRKLFSTKVKPVL